MMTFLTKRNQHTTKPGNLVKWSNISMLLSKMLWCCKYNLWKSFEERMKNARVITQWTVNEAKPNQQWLQALVSHWFKNRIPLSFWCWKDDQHHRSWDVQKVLNETYRIPQRFILQNIFWQFCTSALLGLTDWKKYIFLQNSQWTQTWLPKGTKSTKYLKVKILWWHVGFQMVR